MPTCLQRNALRGKLRSDVDRSVSRGDIVIVDSLNSIKGYRYELWCIARAAGIRYCVLYCDVDEAHCRQWNKERSDRGEASYDDGIFEDLVRRFEKPERRNRWDSHLFELCPCREEINKSSPVSSEAVTYLTKTVDSKTQDVRILQPSIATQGATSSQANSLYVLDRAAQEIINEIAEHQALGGWDITRFTLGQRLPAIEIGRPIGLPELRRHRIAFAKLMGQSSVSGPPLPTDANSAKRRFVDYLNTLKIVLFDVHFLNSCQVLSLSIKIWGLIDVLLIESKHTYE